MKPEVTKIINELHEVLKRELSDETTSVNIFINCDEIRFETSERMPEQLKRQGISMRNIKGNWIKS